MSKLELEQKYVSNFLFNFPPIFSQKSGSMCILFMIFGFFGSLEQQGTEIPAKFWSVWPLNSDGSKVCSVYFRLLRKHFLAWKWKPSPQSFKTQQLCACLICGNSNKLQRMTKRLVYRPRQTKMSAKHFRRVILYFLHLHIAYRTHFN